MTTALERTHDHVRNLGRNPAAQANRWNAYRYPTQAEIAAGRPNWYMIWVGCDVDQSVAHAMLPRGARGLRTGQLQWGIDGQVVAY